jgi:hypothetical protein
MSKKTEMKQLHQLIKDAVDEFKINEIDSSMIDQFAENIYEHDLSLAKQIINGDIAGVDLQQLLLSMALEEESPEDSMECAEAEAGWDELEPHWDELEPHWEDEEEPPKKK